MSLPAGVVHSVRWQEICPWLLLVRAARAALLIRVIVLATLGMWLTHLGWAAIDSVATVVDDGPTASFATLKAPPSLVSWNDPGPPTPQSYVAPTPGQLYAPLARDRWTGPVVRAWAWQVQPLTRLVDARGWRQTIGFLLAGIWTIAVWALFGGAIARIAGLYLARGQTIGPLAALRASATRWSATAGAPTFSFGLIVAVAAPVAVAGALMRWDVFAAVGGVVWFIALGFAALAGALALLHLVGIPFMWATAAVERTDAFDGLSRAWAYTYSRPLHLAFYAAVASLLGVLAETLVVSLANWFAAASWFALSWGAGDARTTELLATANGATKAEPGALLAWGAAGMHMWESALLSLAAAFCMGYFWSAGTGVYLLMRRLVDSTETDEIAFDSSAPEPGIPQLVDDPATGIPQPADAPAADSQPASDGNSK